MEDLDFDTKEKRNIAISNFRTLIEHPGWKLFEKIVLANINIVKDQILNGVDGDTKEEIDRRRDKLKVYEECINTPRSMIEGLGEAKTITTIQDPYDTVEDIKGK